MNSEHQETIYRPSLSSWYARTNAVTPFILGFMMVIVCSVVDDPWDMLIPGLFALIMFIVGVAFLQQKVRVYHNRIVLTMPLAPDSEISLTAAKSLVCEHVTPFTRGLGGRTYTITSVDEAGVVRRYPLYVWDKNEINDILDAVHARHPELKNDPYEYPRIGPAHMA